jgi:hypothetical protein
MTGTQDVWSQPDPSRTDFWTCGRMTVTKESANVWRAALMPATTAEHTVSDGLAYMLMRDAQKAARALLADAERKAELKQQREAHKAAARAVLKDLTDADDLTAEFADQAEEILGDQPERIYRLANLVRALFDERTSGLNTLHVVGSHIEVESVVYPNGSVGLDVAGNIVEVTVSDRCEVE